jgi:hypothetical protein
MVVFHSLAEALKHGYEVFERTKTGYTVRKKTPKGWGLALVDLTGASQAK